METIHIAIIFAAYIIGCSLITMYLVAKNKLDYTTYFSCIGLGSLLAIIAVVAIFSSYLVFVYVMAGYIIYFFYLNNMVQYTFIKESKESAIHKSTMLSLMLGVFVGFFALLGCILCHPK